MDSSFYINNRQALYEGMQPGTVLLCFAGEEKHKTADANYIFFPDRNFVYLTGIDGVEPVGFIFMAVMDEQGIKEHIFTLPNDLMLERWNGKRLTAEEVTQKSGITDIMPLSGFESFFHRTMMLSGIKTLSLDLFKNFVNQPQTLAQKFSQKIQGEYPHVAIKNIHGCLRALRTIKKPCEIENMRRAIAITKSGIEAMMRSSKPGMYEYEYKAEFDYQLTKQGVLDPSFSSIISAGKNNFSIHYYGYRGMAQDGDMILNDVGAIYDGMCCDISRAFPCNGKFSDRQRLLYECAQKTSLYLFSIIKPGMPMKDVDRLSHEFCAKELVGIGLLDDVKNVSRYMWHGGAHHVGFDVHDQVDAQTIKPNMIFCVDVGIYVEEWGIGFRIEDNCLVTEDGCENMSRDIPTDMDDIEKLMNG